MLKRLKIIFLQLPSLVIYPAVMRPSLSPLHPVFASRSRLPLPNCPSLVTAEPVTDSGLSLSVLLSSCALFLTSSGGLPPAVSLVFNSTNGI